MGFDLSRVASGFGKGADCFVGVRFIGGAVEATVERFLGGVEAVTRFEVEEFGRHYGGEGTDDEPAILGFLGNDLGNIATMFVLKLDSVGRQRGL